MPGIQIFLKLLADYGVSVAFAVMTLFGGWWMIRKLVNSLEHQNKAMTAMMTNHLPHIQAKVNENHDIMESGFDRLVAALDKGLDKQTALLEKVLENKCPLLKDVKKATKNKKRLVSENGKLTFEKE